MSLAILTSNFYSGSANDDPNSFCTLGINFYPAITARAKEADKHDLIARKNEAINGNNNGATNRQVSQRERIMGAGPHADVGVITIVAASGPGLQFESEGKRGGGNATQFCDAPFVPNALVINGGKMLAALTRGNLKGE